MLPSDRDLPLVTPCSSPGRLKIRELNGRFLSDQTYSLSPVGNTEFVNLSIYQIKYEHEDKRSLYYQLIAATVPTLTISA